MAGSGRPLCSWRLQAASPGAVLAQPGQNRDMLAVLLYDTAPDYLERRAAHRDAHLALIRRWHEEGKIVSAGALKTTSGAFEGALLVFRCASLDEPAAFAAQDPYVANGVVTGWTVKEWMVVVGNA